MKTISDYSTHCTEEQTKKALELGAPIEYARVIDTVIGNSIRIPNDTGDFYLIPTTEEMIGWLEEKGIFIEIKRFLGRYTFILFKIYEHGEINFSIRSQDFPSRKETMLAAIDAALEYLQKND